MAKMGHYCKAYYVHRFREFPGWTENIGNLRTRTEQVEGKDVEVAREALNENDILYLQENFAVTDGVFIDENVIFDNPTTEWKDFCRQVLHFESPDDRVEGSRSEVKKGIDSIA